METKTFWEFRAENLPEIESRNAKLTELNNKLAEIYVVNTDDSREMIDLYMSYLFNAHCARFSEAVEPPKWRMYALGNFFLIWEVSGQVWRASLKRLIGQFDEELGNEIVEKLITAFKL